MRGAGVVGFGMVVTALILSQPVCAQRAQAITAVIKTAEGLKSGSFIGGMMGGGVPVKDSLREIQSNLINLNEFEKLKGIDFNIQEIYVNIESTAKQGVNATQQALRSLPTSSDYTQLLSGDTGNRGIDDAFVEDILAKNGPGSDATTIREEAADMDDVRYDKSFLDRESALDYVKKTFFVDMDAINAKGAQALQTVQFEQTKKRRQLLLRDVTVDALTYSQLFKGNGKKDFEERLARIKEKQKAVKTETEGIATTTMALKSVLQEVMIQIVLEQKQLKLEAAKVLKMQEIPLAKKSDVKSESSADEIEGEPLR